MKKVVGFLLLLSTILSVGCCIKENEKILVPFNLGDSRKSVVARENLRSVYYLNTLEVFEEKSSIVITIYDNSFSVCSYVVFSKTGNVIVSEGITPISSKGIDSYHGKRFSEFEAVFGAMHCDIGSGIYVPAYIANNGNIVTLGLDSNRIIRSISSIDVAQGTVCVNPIEK